MQNSDITDGAIGLGAGYFTYKGTTKLITKPYSKYVMKCMKDITPHENNLFRQAVQDAFVKSPLPATSVKITDINTSNYKTIIQSSLDEYNKEIKKCNKNIIKKWSLKRKKEKFLNSFEAIANGNNACFMHSNKMVYVNKDKLSISTFHELGHAKNHTATKGLEKFLSNIRHKTAYIAPFIVAMSLLKRKEPDGEKPKTIGGKIINFIKKHCGIITFACMLPTVAEEGLASINGAKLAKNVLNKDMYKKLNKFNAKAFGTYFLGAIAMGVAAKIAVYVKDKILPPKSK